MSINTFVYSHAINAYVIGELGMTVEQFCELYGFVQSTVATWVRRERLVEDLPAGFIYSLALAAGKDMSTVYDCLLKLQEEYIQFVKRNKRVKKSLE
ncbi:type III secretion system protein PrgN [Enterococcus sp. BWR-S5]|uniref:type III secretion system protein PrgN n=1 Tax=Enterococcus sp. BWR-S5 TaxID=2787714 RepID=UPI001923D1CC|nr:type III secretion system protein PrgN [Enterococcus sp. BWR-S5]MBL1227048.1 type III secretion system protein PrgN [Enterococcus sp. BWR-S5]